MGELEDLKKAVAKFRDERDWLQFHTPKDLAIGLSVEASELLEVFLWRPEVSNLEPGDRERVVEEMADVLIFLLNLADRIDVDLSTAVRSKLSRNAEKYPADIARGSAKKYSEYGQ